MKLVNINKNGTMEFQLKDGRTLLSYNSGYVRMFAKSGMIYQINPRSYGERILILCPAERYQYIVNWVNKNVK